MTSLSSTGGRFELRTTSGGGRVFCAKDETWIVPVLPSAVAEESQPAAAPPTLALPTLRGVGSPPALPTLSQSELSIVTFQLAKARPGESVEFVAALFVEYARFLALCLLGIRAVPSPSVDDAWHAHILCTRAYESWCQRYRGGTMLHHNPGSGEADLYDATLLEYESTFGFSPPLAFWPRSFSRRPLAVAAAVATATRSSSNSALQHAAVVHVSSALVEAAHRADTTDAVLAPSALETLAPRLHVPPTGTQFAAAVEPALMTPVAGAGASSGGIMHRPHTLPSSSLPASDVFLSHFQMTGGDQCLLVREALLSAGVRAWYDQDISDLNNATMLVGAISAPLFVLFLSRGVLTRWAVVAHELPSALTHWRRVAGSEWAQHFCFLLEADAAQGGATIADIIAEGASAMAPSRHDGGARLPRSDFDALFPGGLPVTPPIVFQRGRGLMLDTLPALLARIRAVTAAGANGSATPRVSAATPMKLTHAALRAGEDAHVLVLGTTAATNQAAFVALALETRSRSVAGKARLVCSLDGGVNGKGSTAAVDDLVAIGASAAARARLLVVILTQDAWDDARVCGALASAMKRSAPVFLMHEIDARHGGAFPIDAIIEGAPGHLRGAFEKYLAHPFDRALDKRELWLGKLCSAAGLLEAGRGPRAPPPMPPFFYKTPSVPPSTTLWLRLHPPLPPQRASLLPVAWVAWESPLLRSPSRTMRTLLRPLMTCSGSPLANQVGARS